MLIKYCLFLICSFTSLFSAAPIVHLWVAERFCEIHGITDDKILQGIILGTEFPDIRYITRAPRALTHPIVLTIAEVCESATPFEMGMKLHAWLDIVRENFITQEVYEAVTPYAEGHPATLLKFIEDEILADFYDGRKWSCYFNEILPEEVAFASEEIVAKWHGIVQWTMAVRPSYLLWAQSYRGPAFGAPATTLYNWCYLLPDLKQQPIFKHHVSALLDYILLELQNIAF